MKISSEGTAAGILMLGLASCGPGLARIIAREGDAESQQTLRTGWARSGVGRELTQAHAVNSVLRGLPPFR